MNRQSITQFFRHALVFTGTIAALAACEGAGGSSAGLGRNPNGAGKVVTGESCEGHASDQYCIGVKYVVYKDSSGTAVSSAADAAENVRVTNGIWKQCGIAFQIEKYEEVNPADFDLPYGGPSAESQTQASRRAFAEEGSFLVVTTGAWGVTKNAWTNAPGVAPYGAIMEGGIAKGYGEIYAHELGHYLGLDHVSDPRNLLSPVIAPNSVNMTDDQCANSRAMAKDFWGKMLR